MFGEIIKEAMKEAEEDQSDFSKCGFMYGDVYHFPGDLLPEPVFKAPKAGEFHIG